MTAAQRRWLTETRQPLRAIAFSGWDKRAINMVQSVRRPRASSFHLAIECACHGSAEHGSGSMSHDASVLVLGSGPVTSTRV